MAIDILNVIIQLEDNLANFYSRLKVLARLKDVKPVLEFMETHSSAHAETIRNVQGKFKIPEFDHHKAIDLNEKIKNSVYAQVIHEMDISKSMDILADSEESIGEVYKTIAKYYEKVAEIYGHISSYIDKIGSEEFNHRDLLLQEKERLRQKK